MAGPENDEGATKLQQQQIKASEASSVVILLKIGTLCYTSHVTAIMLTHARLKSVHVYRQQKQTKVCLIYICCCCCSFNACDDDNNTQSCSHNRGQLFLLATHDSNTKKVLHIASKHVNGVSEPVVCECAATTA